jgi:hypothetical protein
MDSVGVRAVVFLTRCTQRSGAVFRGQRTSLIWAQHRDLRNTRYKSHPNTKLLKNSADN